MKICCLTTQIIRIQKLIDSFSNNQPQSFGVNFMSRNNPYVAILNHGDPIYYFPFLFAIFHHLSRSDILPSHGGQQSIGREGIWLCLLQYREVRALFITSTWICWQESERGLWNPSQSLISIGFVDLLISNIISTQCLLLVVEKPFSGDIRSIGSTIEASGSSTKYDLEST